MDDLGHALVAASSATDDRSRLLKHGDTFAVFDHYGDMKTGGLDEEGLYHEGTRYLSRLQLKLDGGRPFYLSSTVTQANDELTLVLTNPDRLVNGQVQLPLGTLELALKKFLWRGALHQRLRLKNYGMDPVTLKLGFFFAADYADIFEVRGRARKLRGTDLVPELGGNRVTLGYRGLDGVERHTLLEYLPAPTELGPEQALYHLTLAPKQGMEIYLVAHCTRDLLSSSIQSFEAAREEAKARHANNRGRACRLSANNSHVDAWIQRAAADLHMMVTELPTGQYPYAGIPWFNTPFGRDGIITALEALWLHPDLGAGVLRYLASTQATSVVSEEDAEPGKILHETRRGEMAALKEIPFGRYYGSADATPLFVVLAGAYYERTGDDALLREIWPNLQAALEWIDRYGDRDGDGFVEYQRRTESGLVHQGWKDSDDSVFHSDGSLADGPIALVEVQSYVYAARRAGAMIATLLGQQGLAERLLADAEGLRQRFERAFWCENLDTYALALDGRKRPCAVRASNAGHCLFAGIASEDHAARVAKTLLGPDSFSGWGIRTVAQSESRYNPMAYHNGTVWPHDTALVASGLARYGHQDEALEIWNGVFQAGVAFDLQRMPELFCGFPRRPFEDPVQYPVACAPQAWSAASVFLLFQSCLGLSIDGCRRRVCFTRPRLPACIDSLVIERLDVGGASVDLSLVRHESDVGVDVLRRDGDVSTVVVK